MLLSVAQTELRFFLDVEVVPKQGCGFKLIGGDQPERKTTRLIPNDKGEVILPGRMKIAIREANGGQFIEVTPLGKFRKREIQTFKPTDVDRNEKALIRAMDPYVPTEPWTGPVWLTAIFYFAWEAQHGPTIRGMNKRLIKHTKPDAGNLMKQLDDCLERAGFVVNDSQIQYRAVERYYADRVGVDVKLERLAV